MTTTKDLSKYLDGFGWTKVICDVREHLPSIGSSAENDDEGGVEDSLTAQQLLEKYNQGRFKTLPFGHTVLVANSKSNFYRYINQGGRPIMNYLAKSILSKLAIVHDDQ